VKYTIPIAVLVTAAFLLAVGALPSLPGAAAQQAGQDQEQPQGGDMGGFQFADHGIHGTITTVAGNTVTVKTDQGESWSVATGPNTRFRKQRDEIKIADLHAGDEIAAVGDKDSKTKTVGAVFVIVIDREQEQKMRADFGKTWTAGVVESIDGTNIVIKRPDDVTQTIAVDENTSFRRRRGEAITLPDIKVGENLSARGALQNGSFLATLVNVGGPAARAFGTANGRQSFSAHPDHTNTQANTTPASGATQPN
jgi:Domain of unknown function (DUF5666)